MAKKTALDEEKNELVRSEFDDMLAPSNEAGYSRDDAGKGAEDAEATIVPRVGLLQAQSKPCLAESPGAGAGVYWMTPQNRPATFRGHASVPDRTARFVPVRILQGRTRWKPLDQGGGIICASQDGKTARDANGIAGATPVIVANDLHELTEKITWDGGHATDKCADCIFGTGLVKALTGKPETGRSSRGWFPKKFVFEGVEYTVPASYRKPQCTPSIDVLGLFFLPAHEGMQMEVVPAIMSFNNTAEPAGSQLMSQVAMATGQPAWAKMWELGIKLNEKPGQRWYTPTVRPIGFTPAPLAAKASELYDTMSSTKWEAHVEDPHESNVTSDDDDKQPDRDDGEESKGDF